MNGFIKSAGAWSLQRADVKLLNLPPRARLRQEAKFLAAVVPIGSVCSTWSGKLLCRGLGEALVGLIPVDGGHVAVCLESVRYPPQLFVRLRAGAHLVHGHSASDCADHAQWHVTVDGRCCVGRSGGIRAW